MENYRSRPKGDYIESEKWQGLYALTEHWKSDLLFYRDDLKFLRHLVDNYFIWIKDQENLEGIRKVGEAILKNTRQCQYLLDMINKYLSYLVQIIDKTPEYNSKNFRAEHGKLEDDITQFIKNVRENRKHLFKITEYVMHEEKSEKYLKG